MRGGRGLAAPLVVVVAAVLLTNCTGGGRTATGNPSATADLPSTAAPSATTSASPSAARSSPSGSHSPTPAKSPSTFRPLLPVPPVIPPGIVAPPPGAGLDRYARQPLHWTPCSHGLQCATVLVPLDYARPDDRAVTLELARRSSTAARRLGSLFLNPGGPGGSGIGFVSDFPTVGLEGYDLIGWDPRGVGRSTPVSCVNGAALDRYFATDTSPDTPAETAALIAESRAFGRSCLDRSGVLLEHVSTEETARDLDLLRGLVGADTLDYLGGSYGTYLGAVYAQLFPQRVGRLVLDGAVDLTGHSVSQAKGFDRALNNFAGWCVSAGCGLGTDRTAVLHAITGLWDRLDTEPMTVGNRQLTQSLGVTAVIGPLYDDQRTWKFLATGLARALAGNGVYLLSLADAENERHSNGSYSQLNDAFPAIRCLDTRDSGVAGAERDAERQDREAPTIGRYLGPDLTCPEWPVAARPDLPRITAAGAPPILVVGTTGDPATPYENAQGMARQLRSGVLLTYRGFGHTAYGRSACVRRVVQAYLVRGAVPADGTVC